MIDAGADEVHFVVWDVDPAREHAVPPRMVLLPVGEQPQVPDREEGRSPFDHALESEREEREASGPQSLHEPQAALADDVDEREPEQPVHPPLENARIRGAIRREGSESGVVRHRDILGVPNS